MFFSVFTDILFNKSVSTLLTIVKTNDFGNSNECN